jgi:hypothetical protein
MMNSTVPEKYTHDLNFNLNFLFERSHKPCAVKAGPLPPIMNTAQNAAYTAPDCEYCPECCHEQAKIEGGQSDRHFTVNEGDAGDAASLILFFKPHVKRLD